MSITIDNRVAEMVLERAALKAASTEPVDALWEQRARELEQWPSNRVAIAAFGTALLAKAVNPDIDALSLTPESGANGYRPRSLARGVLAAKREDLKYALGTKAPDPMAASPWFGDVARIDLITKWRKSMRVNVDRMVGWLGALQPDEAEGALAAFLRVRMEVYAEQQELRVLEKVDAATVTFDDLVSVLRPFVETNPEEGRRGAAAVAAAYAAAGWDVVARPVNDPGQIDVDINRAGQLVAGAEVKQKPATAQDARDIAEGVADAGASKALLVALDPAQPPLDDSRLISQADTDSGVSLAIVYGISHLLRTALFSSDVSRDDFLSSFPAEMARLLAELDASVDGRRRWKAVTDRWMGDA